MSIFLALPDIFRFVWEAEPPCRHSRAGVWERGKQYLLQNVGEARRPFCASPIITACWKLFESLEPCQHLLRQRR
jgi:hypothetical protein